MAVFFLTANLFHRKPSIHSFPSFQAIDPHERNHWRIKPFETSGPLYRLPISIPPCVLFVMYVLLFWIRCPVALSAFAKTSQMCIISSYIKWRHMARQTQVGFGSGNVLLPLGLMPPSEQMLSLVPKTYTERHALYTCLLIQHITWSQKGQTLSIIVILVHAYEVQPMDAWR